MPNETILHRDRVLRAYFEGRDWDQNGEFVLKRQLVLEGLEGFTYLFDDEWEVSPGYTNEGRGDLLFFDGEHRFAVVEVKYIDTDITSRRGKTKRSSNRKKRRKVEEQAERYAEIVAAWLPPRFTIEAYIFTNEHSTPQLLASFSGTRAAADG